MHSKKFFIPLIFCFLLIIPIFYFSYSTDVNSTPKRVSQHYSQMQSNKRIQYNLTELNAKLDEKLKQATDRKVGD